MPQNFPPTFSECMIQEGVLYQGELDKNEYILIFISFSKNDIFPYQIFDSATSRISVLLCAEAQRFFSSRIKSGEFSCCLIP